mgnify:CR=1 FL=1
MSENTKLWDILGRTDPAHRRVSGAGLDREIERLRTAPDAPRRPDPPPRPDAPSRPQPPIAPLTPAGVTLPSRPTQASCDCR